PSVCPVRTRYWYRHRRRRGSAWDHPPPDRTLPWGNSRASDRLGIRCTDNGQRYVAGWQRCCRRNHTGRIQRSQSFVENFLDFKGIAGGDERLELFASLTGEVEVNHGLGQVSIFEHGIQRSLSRVFRFTQRMEDRHLLERASVVYVTRCNQVQFEVQFVAIAENGCTANSHHYVAGANEPSEIQVTEDFLHLFSGNVLLALVAD